MRSTLTDGVVTDEELLQVINNGIIKKGSGFAANYMERLWQLEHSGYIKCSECYTLTKLGRERLFPT